MHKACFTNRKLRGIKGDEVLSKYGSIAHWRERKGGIVPVTCGVCEIKRGVAVYTLYKPCANGLHPKCYQKIRRLPDEIEIGNEGSIFYPHMIDPLDPTKRAVKCGRCNQIRYAPPYYGKHLKRPGICPFCRSGPDEKKLPQGTIVLFRKRKVVIPASGRPYHMIAIRCRGCFDKIGEEKFVHRSNITKYLADPEKHYWDELCSDCTRARGNWRKYTGIVTNRKGTEFNIPADVTKPVQVTYGKCRHSYETLRNSVSSHFTRWQNICPECKKDPERYRLRMLELEASRNEQTNGNGNKERKARFDVTKFINNYRASVCALWDRTHSVDACANAKALLVELQDRGEEITTYQGLTGRFPRAGFEGSLTDIAVAILLKERPNFRGVES